MATSRTILRKQAIFMESGEWERVDESKLEDDKKLVELLFEIKEANMIAIACFNMGTFKFYSVTKDETSANGSIHAENFLEKFEERVHGIMESHKIGEENWCVKIFPAKDEEEIILASVWTSSRGDHKKCCYCKQEK